MGIFGKERAHEREQAQRVIRLPVTGHEVTDIIHALSAIRTGERGALSTHMSRLSAWNPTRLVIVLTTCCERYLKYLSDLHVIDLDGDEDASKQLVDTLLAALPVGTQPSEDVMFDALVICAAAGPSVYQRIETDVEGAIIGELSLLAALCSLASQVPPGRIPNVAEMFHGIVAPF